MPMTMIDNLRRAALAALLLVPMLIAATSAARADTITFKLRSFAKESVSVNFHSASRKVVWPSGGKLWTLKDNKVQEFKLTCVAGEQVCYGAFDTKRNWGVGRDGKQSCTACCATCKGDIVTKVFDINEG